MVLPCWTVTHFGLPPAVRHAFHVAGAALRPVHRHTLHRLHPLLHAASSHPAVWVEIVCRGMPLAVAAGLMGSPVSAPLPVLPPPAGIAAPSQPTGTNAAAPPPAFFDFAPLSPGPGGTPGPRLITLSYNAVPPAPPSPSDNTGQLPPTGSPPPGYGGSLPPGARGFGVPPGPTPVPEPSVFAVFIGAAIGVSLLRRKRTVSTLNREV